MWRAPLSPLKGKISGIAFAFKSIFLYDLRKPVQTRTVFLSMQDIQKRIETDRKALLDLTLRNPLLSFRTSRVHGVEVVQERSEAIYRLLVSEGKKLYFKDNGKEEAPEAKAVSEEGEMPQIPETELQKRHTDNLLQTAETAHALQKRLLKTYYDANASLQEQGINILYLALGMLYWYESDTSEDPKKAPLVLVPVMLERNTSSERFSLTFTKADVESNLSLQEKLKAEFGIRMPLLTDGEYAGPAAYFEAVQAALAGKKRWRIEADECHLGFFSFNKLMLYKDLDSSRWPGDAQPADHALMQALLASGFSDPEPSVGDSAFLDATPAANDLLQVLDADGTQVQAMLAVDEGRNLVIQGPPGTGKSQTITNLIANAIGKGKRVLFVAEKLAALEVVKRRLDAVNLGDACLELHSHKANKKDVLNALQKTLDLGKPQTATLEAEARQTERYRSELNGYCAAVNTVVGNSGLTPFDIMGNLYRQQQECGNTYLPTLSIPEIGQLGGDRLRRAEDFADKIEGWLQNNGLPSQLPFWGSGLRVMLPADAGNIQQQISNAQKALDQQRQILSQIAASTGLSIPQNSAQANRLKALLQRAGEAPRLEDAQLENPAWVRSEKQILETIEAGKSATALYETYAGRLMPEAWTADYAPVYSEIKTHGRKWWKFLIGSYRQAVKTLNGWVKSDAPKDFDGRIHLLEDLSQYQQLTTRIATATPLMQPLFPQSWVEKDTNWQALEGKAVFLINAHKAIAAGNASTDLFTVLKTKPATAAGEDATRLQAAESEWARSETLLLQTLRYQTPAGVEDGLPFSQWSYTTQHEKLAVWQRDVSTLQQSASWNTLCDSAAEAGCDFLCEASASWPEAAHQLHAAFLKTFWEHHIQNAFSERLPLRQFDLSTHTDVLQKFRNGDVLNQQYHRAKAALEHFNRLPARNGGGQMATLSQEFNKKARHKPIRKLMEEAGTAIQAIKPVFMMSPLSVANYLTPGVIQFDLVVFDEASQVKPVDAFGAILRGQQLVVVGDTKQLPPTSFFDRLVASDEATEADEEEFTTADVPSILGLCNAQQAPEKMLRWHYRSRHESLIAVSNHAFYEDRLVVFPSPAGAIGNLGLVYHHLPNTVYGRGGSRTNKQEAEAVADAVMRHAAQTPGKSLGVVAFSEAQKGAIMDAVEARRRQAPHLEPFFATGTAEPFFVKNLESVQGDERDVIMISVGYGKDANGYFAMSFGPLNNEGGEKRLNVLITRAKERCEVFTNLRPEDIDLARAKGEGVRAFKMFLQYAATGILDVPRPTGKEADSPFEEAVCRQLEALGYTVHQQVGSNGFFIDLAVVDKEAPGRYVIGIECDGATYHSARSARDRDRLRQAALENMGWTFHRIWSTDWFRHPERELRRLVEAIEKAQVGQPIENNPQEETVLASALSRAEVAESPESDIPKYVHAKLPAGVASAAVDFHKLPRRKIADWLETVVRIESPVHIDDVTRRLTEAAGLARVGGRIKSAVEEAAAFAAASGHIERKGDFLWHISKPVAAVRDRSELHPYLRKIQLIAPEEIAEALVAVTAAATAINEDGLIAGTGRMLGFSRITEELRSAIATVLKDVLTSGRLVEKGGWVMEGERGG